MDAADLVKVIVHYLDNQIAESVNVATPEVYTIREMAEIAVRAW
jgi:GDP-D-mannose dehydratase